MISAAQLKAALHTALEAAGRGTRGANPLVGACILDEDARVIATGFHLGAGNPHAEIDALRRLGMLSKQAASKLTMVVTLEPCNHQGRTGPCSHAIAKAGIGHVHYAVRDETGASGGAEYLRSRGVTVSHASDPASWELNHRWFKAQAEKRPFITVKTAQSLDGRINAPDGTSQWITGDASRAHAHSLRAQVDAIVVGTGTVVADDPRLSARTAAGGLHEQQPYRLIVGQRQLGDDLALAFDERWEQIHTREVHEVVRRASELGFRHLLIEGGATLASAFIEADLADELYCYQAPVIIGGGSASVNLPSVQTLSQARAFRLDPAQGDPIKRLGDDVLLHLEPLPVSPTAPSNPKE